MKHPDTYNISSVFFFVSELSKSTPHRPQVSYLQLVESRGIVPALPAKISKKYHEEQEKNGIPKCDDNREKHSDDKHLENNCEEKKNSVPFATVFLQGALRSKKTSFDVGSFSTSPYMAFREHFTPATRAGSFLVSDSKFAERVSIAALNSNVLLPSSQGVCTSGLSYTLSSLNHL